MRLEFERVSITHILLMSLVLHAFVISFPEDWLVFDEGLFSWASRTLLMGEDRTPYQMPGLHIIGATFISLMGDDWFSLRAPVVVFGLGVLWVFYLISKKFTSKENALLATTIFSFDTIFFFHSQLFLRDVPMMFFGFLGVYFFLNKKYFLSGTVIGFGALIKETILFILILLIIYQIIISIKNRNLSNKIFFQRQNYAKVFGFCLIIGTCFIIPLWVYDVMITPIMYEPAIPIRINADGTETAYSYPQILVYEQRGYSLQEKIGEISNPWQHLKFYFDSGLLAGAYDSKNRNVTQNYIPTNWILPLPTDTDSGRGGIGMGYKKSQPFDEVKNGWPHKGEEMGVDRLAYPNLGLWPLGFWATISFIGFSLVKKKNIELSIFLGIGLLTLYGSYILLNLINGRVMLPYYFILTVPIISLGSVCMFHSLKSRILRISGKLILLSFTVVWFVYYFPIKLL